MIVLIDSWAWIEFFKGSKAGEKVKDFISGSDIAVISAINMAEVYRWFLGSYTETEAEEARGVIKETCYVVPVTEAIAVNAAKIKHKKKWGLGDSIAYATAKQEKAEVITGDPDFKGIKDVVFIG
ncbi:MAG: type II toxin-antitoxin system VapC family toxin [Candidatus Hydrothermarchaeales archaeon]